MGRGDEQDATRPQDALDLGEQLPACVNMVVDQCHHDQVERLVCQESQRLLQIVVVQEGIGPEPLLCGVQEVSLPSTPTT